MTTLWSNSRMGEMIASWTRSRSPTSTRSFSRAKKHVRFASSPSISNRSAASRRRTSRTRSSSSGRRAFTAAKPRSRRSSASSGAPAGSANAELEAHLARGRKAVEWSRYYEEARELATLLTEWALSLESTHHRFVVTSGGGPGIMEAANRGAHEAGGKTIGLNIRLPFEQGANRYITDGLHFEFHYFFMRKFWFAYLAKALVIFPGGFGTLDEMFEILTLMQTEKLAKQIQIILYGTDYWDPIVNLKPMEEWGAISPGDIDLVQRANTPQEAFELLKAHLTEHHLMPPTPQEMKAPGIAKTRS